MQKVIITEHDIQKSLIRWRDLSQKSRPELGLLFAIPNGGARHVVVAKKLKDEGVLAGVPDLFLPVARGGYHGLFIELKRQGGRLSEAQRNMIGKLETQNYAIVICYDLSQAIEAINDYLSHPVTITSHTFEPKEIAS